MPQQLYFYRLVAPLPNPEITETGEGSFAYSHIYSFLSRELHASSLPRAMADGYAVVVKGEVSGSFILCFEHRFSGLGSALLKRE